MPIPESVTVYLTANGKNTGRFAVLSDVNDWTYIWTELPVYNSNGNSVVAASFNADNIQDSQKWLVTLNGNSVYLSDSETGNYLYCSSSINIVFLCEQLLINNY